MSQHYTDEFKTMIVQLYKSGKPAAEIMREFGLTASAFYEWTKAKAEIAADGEIVSAEEFKKLKEQLDRLTTENEILKMAMAIIASNQKLRSY